MKIAITGSISVGKSFVFNLIKEIEKDYIFLDLDNLTHKIYEKEEIKIKLKEIFKTSNRKEISKIVFNDKEKMKKLNEIMHKKIILILKEYLENNNNIYVDIPLLYELNLEKLFDKVILVYVNKENQIKRLMKRDKISKIQAMMKINSQMDIEEKKKSRYIIDNNSNKEKTIENTIKILKEIKSDN